MQYFGQDIKKLGFGLMRLPKSGLQIDVEQTKKMVDMFMEAGFTYFDTAYVYLGSEAATRKALVERYPRDSFMLASKLNAQMATTEKAAKAQLNKSLERAGVDYFDCYLLHALMANNVKRYNKFDLWDFLLEQKEKGITKHIGFSYHSGPQLLDRLLTDHPEVDLVQLQLNYADWDDPSVESRANYEVARKHNKGIVVMEPVKGGKLADPPAEVKKMFDEYSDRSYASWAIRFAASLDGIITVLSGMSNLAQMQDNLSYMKDFTPLNSDERAIIMKAQQILKKSAAIPCTACRYCTEGCPKQIDIPSVFAVANKHLSGGQLEEAKQDYAKLSGGKAADCITCRKCEAVCPQHINIADELKKCRDLLES